MNNVEELLRDALGTEADRFEPSFDLWPRINEARVPRRRRFVLPVLAVAATATVAVAVVALLPEDDDDQVVTVPPAAPITLAPLPGTQVPVTVECPDIGFTPNSDDVAGDIRATGTDCPTATAFIHQVRRTHNFYDDPPIFEAEGFSCSVVVDETELPSGRYACVSGIRRITWEKT